MKNHIANKLSIAFAVCFFLCSVNLFGQQKVESKLEQTQLEQIKEGKKQQKIVVKKIPIESEKVKEITATSNVKRQQLKSSDSKVRKTNTSQNHNVDVASQKMSLKQKIDVYHKNDKVALQKLYDDILGKLAHTEAGTKRADKLNRVLEYIDSLQ